MGSIVTFSQQSSVNPARTDTNPFRNGADLEAESESDQERIRARVNLFAAVVVVLLIAAGWWIVNSLAETHKAQSCYTSGTRYCSLI
jgi:hypothetical protein